mmetsp:Transcript_63912/g.171225  ORF Transcript_63912/g.171225 Transcript_63912/m.171225 type:complete len:205 (+) Transcript_63912:55-669(+)
MRAWRAARTKGPKALRSSSRDSRPSPSVSSCLSASAATDAASLASTLRRTTAKFLSSLVSSLPSPSPSKRASATSLSRLSRKRARCSSLTSARYSFLDTRPSPLMSALRSKSSAARAEAVGSLMPGRRLSTMISRTCWTSRYPRLVLSTESKSSLARLIVTGSSNVVVIDSTNERCGMRVETEDTSRITGSSLGAKPGKPCSWI